MSFGRRQRDGVVIGAIGASAGTVAQDTAVAAAAISALEPNIVERLATVADQN